MEVFKKVFLIFLVIGAVFCIKMVLYPSQPVDVSDITNEKDGEKFQQEEQTQEVKIPKDTVTIYFIGQNSNKEDVYKIVKREYDTEKDGTKLEYVLNELLRGPLAKESAQGIYTEIPKGTKLRSISKISGKLYIDLSEDFEQGGGTDGLYKRLYQLIKTVNKNTNEDVYLKIEGREVDVIGGEGIMINQPLKPTSLGE